MRHVAVVACGSCGNCQLAADSCRRTERNSTSATATAISKANQTAQIIKKQKKRYLKKRGTHVTLQFICEACNKINLLIANVNVVFAQKTQNKKRNYSHPHGLVGNPFKPGTQLHP